MKKLVLIGSLIVFKAMGAAEHQQAIGLVQQIVQEPHNSNLQNGLRIVVDGPEETVYRGVYEGQLVEIREQVKFERVVSDKELFLVYSVYAGEKLDVTCYINKFWGCISKYDGHSSVYAPVFTSMLEHFNLKKPTIPL